MPTATTPDTLTVAALFAGIGGIESGFARAGLSPRLLCESWAPARAVLSDRFPDVRLDADVRDLHGFPTSMW